VQFVHCSPMPARDIVRICEIGEPCEGAAAGERSLSAANGWSLLPPIDFGSSDPGSSSVVPASSDLDLDDLRRRWIWFGFRIVLEHQPATGFPAKCAVEMKWTIGPAHLFKGAVQGDPGRCL